MSMQGTARPAREGAGCLYGGRTVWKPTVYAALALTLPVAAVAQGRLGPEFQVNEATTDGQTEAAVATASDGSFVVVWSSLDGSFQGVFGRRFDAAGMPLTADFQVNAYTTGTQTGPVVA